MVIRRSSTGVASEPIGGGRFHFVQIQGPGDTGDQSARRRAKSHAVKKALENKRKLQRESRDNFRVATVEDKPGMLMARRRRVGAPDMAIFSPSAGALDPFQSLAVDSSRLQTLLGNYKARQAPEPVFSVAEELAFQSFHSVFRTGLVDPALLNAVMLSLAFAVTGGSIDQECLGYRGQAIRCVRERMGSLHEATSESTIGAILLLAGVEARLGMTAQVQLHMGAVQRLLDICQSRGVTVTGGIKRAVFWQDLNSSILTGSSRIVSHTTFSELQWTRASFSSDSFRLPPGFETRTHLFTAEFIEVLEDIQVLLYVREASRFANGGVKLMANVNNHTASIQSRLMGLSSLSPVQECCRLAGYMCSVMLCCTVWCALVIPSHISSRLLRELLQANNDPIWDEHPELLLWLVCIGGAFAPAGITRFGYVALLRANIEARLGGLYSSWPKLLRVLGQFTWSDKAFAAQVKAFWEEISS